MGAVLIITAFSVLAWWLERTAKRLPSRHGPVRRRDGLRASKAAEAAALRAAEGCVLCDEMPCEAGPHFRWVGTWVDTGGDA